MTWEDILKGLVQYSGDCRRCKEYVEKGNDCPIKLPAHPIQPNCPMKIDDSAR